MSADRRLYGALYRMVPTPVIALNAAAAMAMPSGPEEGLEWMERVASHEPLGDSHLLPAAERKYLERRLREVPESGPPKRPEGIGVR